MLLNLSNCGIGIILILWFCSGTTFAAKPDWNESQIQWQDYQSGMAEAVRTNKPVLLIFYADWCPTCHAYKNIFNKPRIIALAQQLIMIRVNVDQHPQLNKQYDLDGDYVPRSFALTGEGEVRQEIYAKKRYRYFIKSSDANTFELLLSKAIKG